MPNNLVIKNIDFFEYNNLVFDNEFSYIQSWDYGNLKSSLEGLVVNRYLISDSKGKPVAYFQLLTLMFFNINVYSKINRAPIIFDNTYSEQEIILSIKNFLVNNWTLIFDIAPNMRISSHRFMEEIGFFKKNISSWGSSLLDLSMSLDDLYKNLDSKWRNSMLKAEKNSIIVKQCDLKKEIGDIKNMYLDLQKKNNFKGLSSIFLDYISDESNFKELSFNAFSAFSQEYNQSVGYIMVINNKMTSTYLLGVNNDLGRKYNVNSFLLWNTIVFAKSNGLNYFDSGGMNADTPIGIFKFKEGLNGLKYTLIGEFRHIIFISFFVSLFYRICNYATKK